MVNKFQSDTKREPKGEGTTAESLRCKLIARRLTGVRPAKRGETWVYPKSVSVLRAARVRTIGEYIADRRRNILRTIVD